MDASKSLRDRLADSVNTGNPGNGVGRGKGGKHRHPQPLFELIALERRVLLSGSSPYADAVLADAPEGYWRLGETSGTAAAADASGRGHAGTYTGNVTLGRAGALAGDADPAAGFDGSTAHVAVPDHPALDFTAALTVEAWVRPSDTADYRLVVEKGGNALRSYELDVEVDTGRARFVLGQGGSGGFTVVTAAGPLAMNRWHHLVGTYDGTAVRLYVDGQLDGQAAASGPVNLTDDVLAIGRLGSVDANHFYGDLDEVAVYDHALPAGRVAAHHQAGRSRYAAGVLADAPLGYWRLGEAAGAAALDASGYGRHGVYAGAVTPGQGGAPAGDPDTAVAFAGGRVDLPERALWDPLSTGGSATVEAWFRTTGGGGGVIFGYADAADPAAAAEWVPALYVGADGLLRGAVWDFAGAGPVTAAAAPAVDDGALHHAAVAAGGGTLTLYLDGAAVGSAAARPGRCRCTTTRSAPATGPTGRGATGPRPPRSPARSTRSPSTGPPCRPAASPPTTSPAGAFPPPPPRPG
jgi:hypothetical protein